MKTITYTITDADGIHARPAGRLTKEAGKFQSKITIKTKGKSGDAKRIFSVMALGARCGDEITVTIEGADEDAAADALMQFFKENL